MKTIEVEIRGNLTKEQYDELISFLQKKAKYLGKEDREIYLLRDYEGYSLDFVGRKRDIRLRMTNGECEIIMKDRVGEGREEIILPLKDKTLDNAKKIVKALGCKQTVWMHRVKDLFELGGVEWSLVTVPGTEYRYYESEIVVSTEDQIPEAEKKLRKVAKKLNLKVLDDKGTRELIDRLNKNANKILEL